MDKIEKATALAAAMAQIDKDFGLGTIVTSSSKFRDVRFIPSGSISIDYALGGGWARGRIAEIFGLESVGKSTVALHAVAECQKQGGTATYVDAEHCLDLRYAKALGVDVEHLLISQPTYGEQALSVCEMLVKSEAVDLIIVDSVAALVPQAELEGDMSENQMGLQARLMSKAMRKLTGVCHSSDTAIIFINQIRQKIGVVYGSPNVTTGGNALKFYASQRVEIKKSGQIKEGVKEDAVVTGNETSVKCVKNKVGPPFREANVIINFGEGIDKYVDLLRQAVENEIVQKGGPWYSFESKQIGQGEPKTAAFLKSDPVTTKLIWDKVQAKLNSSNA